jgi:hypothetical protein
MNKLDFGKLVARDINMMGRICFANANVFGGFIRDMLAGGEPNDIDVLCCVDKTPLDCIQALLLHGYTINKSENKNNKNPGYGRSFTVVSISVSSKDEGQIDIDIVKPEKNGSFIADVDVNRLVWNPVDNTLGMMTSEDLIYIGPVSLTILDQIKEKKFKKEFGTSCQRVLHMTTKGWIEISR